jgi:hypothetical protein
MIKKILLALAATGLAVLLGAAPWAAKPPVGSGPDRLAAALAKAAAYCQKLENAALDFVCFEEVTETSHNLSASTDVYLYDYQFIRKGGGARERRDLVSLNGKKANYRDTPLHTAFFQYKNVLFGPVGLLAPAVQALFIYAFVGEETLKGQKIMIVEVKPGPDPAVARPYGRVWVSESDGSVLKIVWDQRSLGNFKTVEEWAKEHGAEPRITSLSEYGVIKNGLRFPSRSYTDQAYLRKDRGKFSSAEITILYKGYRFFTVETETNY